MPTKAKKNKNAKKTAKPQNKKVAVKAKKNGKTVTFQSRPATDPFAPHGHRPNSPASNDPRVCECGDLDCPTTQKLQHNELPPIIQQFAKELGEQMGAQHVMVVGIPLNPANPRTEPPSQAEFEGLLRAILGGN